ncbi:hypothetical protein NB693_20445 [Pantoea ananatis]|uniref:hypothetical protein n=1 Tax=Pantoea ananas TaxID=553 RepID=UPI002220F8CC|nr:hypothetical protein [Pantoea ananatis]
MSNFAIAPLPFDAQSDGVTVAANNPYNPFGVQFGPNDYELRTRFTTLGQREGFYDTATDQDVIGLKGGIGDSSWVWDANFNYGHYRQRTWSHGYVDVPALQSAIDSGQVDIFDQGSANTVAWLQSNASVPRQETTTIMRQWEASANGSLWDMPAGAAQLAVGALYRKESLGADVSSNALINSGLTCEVSSEACGSPLGGSFNVKEAYAQLFTGTGPAAARHRRAGVPRAVNAGNIDYIQTPVGHSTPRASTSASTTCCRRPRSASSPWPWTAPTCTATTSTPRIR